MQAALLSRQSGDLLVVEGNVQFLRHDFSDLLAGGAVLPCDGDDHALVGRLDRGGGSLWHGGGFPLERAHELHRHSDHH